MLFKWFKWSLICKFFAVFSPNLQADRNVYRGQLIVNHIKYFEQPFWSAHSTKSVLNEYRSIWFQAKLYFLCPFILIFFGLKLDLMGKFIFFQEKPPDKLISASVLWLNDAFVGDLCYFNRCNKCLPVFFFVSHCHSVNRAFSVPLLLSCGNISPIAQVQLCLYLSNSW